MQSRQWREQTHAQHTWCVMYWSLRHFSGCGAMKGSACRRVLTMLGTRSSWRGMANCCCCGGCAAPRTGSLASGMGGKAGMCSRPAAPAEGVTMRAVAVPACGVRCALVGLGGRAAAGPGFAEVAFAAPCAAAPAEPMPSAVAVGGPCKGTVWVVSSTGWVGPCRVTSPSFPSSSPSSQSDRSDSLDQELDASSLALSLLLTASDDAAATDAAAAVSGTAWLGSMLNCGVSTLPC
eukprot:1150646-Pelagomonas_calceolata.AAC.4